MAKIAKTFGSLMSNSEKRRDFLKLSASALSGLLLGSLYKGTHTPTPSKEAMPHSKQTSKLAGKVALVTGGARGIGLAIAIDLARNGADVALLDIAKPDGVRHIKTYSLSSEQDLNEAAEKVRAEGVRVIKIVADVRELAAMKKAAEQVERELGRIDILVANAGVASWSLFAKMEQDQWTEVIDVNLNGVANSVWSVLPAMQKQNNGRIIVITSVCGRVGLTGLASYCASKWAVIGLVKTLALELGKNNILVNAVAPTAVNTPLYRSEGQRRSWGVSSSSEQDRYMSMFHAINVPAIEPKDVADAVSFLVSDESKMITGNVLDVAAGINAHYTA